MRAADIMTHRVVTVGPETTIAETAQLMLKHGVSGLPVVDDAGALVGMVTEGDLLRRTETGTERRRPRWLEFLLGPGRLAGEYVHTHGRKVAEVMTARPITITPEMPLEQVVGLMEKHRIKRLPVLEHGRICGIVSRANLLPVLAHLASLAPPTSTSDSEIRKRVLTEFDRERWAMRGCIDVVVSNGTVELHGVIGDERERSAARVAAENVPGVKAIVDHLVWVEPVSGMVIEPRDDEPKSAAMQAAVGR